MNENGQVEGRNAVAELIESGKDINKIFVSNRRKAWKIRRNNKKSKSKSEL